MYYDIYEDDWFPEDPKDEVSSLMSSQYLQSSRQVVYSPSKQPNSQQVQQPATSMYTTTSGFQTFHFTPTYADANGEQAKIEPHEGDGQVRVLMPLYQNASSSGTTSTMVPVKFVDASGGNSVILSTANGNYTQNGTIVHQGGHHQPQYQTIQLTNQPHVQHQVVSGQILNTSSGQGHFANQVQYIVVQHPGNGVPVEIKTEMDGTPVSSDGIDVRRAKDANRKRRRRLTESEEEAMARRQKNLEAKRRRLARETDEERRRRRQRDAEAKRRRRERETEDQRLARLARDSARMRRTRRLKKAQLKGEPLESIVDLPPPPPPASGVGRGASNTRYVQHQNKMESQTYLSPSSAAAINQTIAAVVDNKHGGSNMVVLDQKPGFITSGNHGHAIQIPANSMVQTVAMPPGMITIPGGQGPQGQVQQIILLPPPGQQPSAVAIPAGTQIIQRHPDSSASSQNSFLNDSIPGSMLPDDPAERQRIRNKERARRRRANETPEQRALRNMKTAERMRRRRAQLAEQRALANGITQQTKTVLTPEEISARFDDIFKSVLARADYEVEHNGPIVPRPKIPQYEEAGEVYVDGDGEFVIEQHVDDDHDGGDTTEEIPVDEHDDEQIEIEYKHDPDEEIVVAEESEQVSDHGHDSVSDDVLQHDEPSQQELEEARMAEL